MSAFDSGAFDAGAFDAEAPAPAQVRVYWLEVNAVSSSSQSLLPNLFTNSQSFYSASVATGNVSVAPVRFDNVNSFYPATLTRGAVTLVVPHIASTNAFYTASVGVGAVTLSPSLVASSNAFYSHSISQNGATQTLSATRFDNTSSFNVHTLTRGAVSLSATRFDNTNSFFSATVSQAGATQTLSPPLVASNPFSTRPALLLHMDGTNGSTVIVDDSSYSASFTNIGSATLTTSDKVFGSASLSMTRGFTINGDIDRFKFSGDYTIDMWIKVSSWTNDALFTMTDSPGFLKYLWNLNAQGGLELTSIGASSTSSKTADAIVPLNTWTHVQIARSGTTTRIWLDGTVRSTFTDSANYAAGVHGVARVQIGEYVGNEQFNGLMDEVRVLSGEAANTGNFTPPSAAYSYSSTGFFNHSVTVGVVSLSAARFDNTNSFFSATVGQTIPSQTLSASLFTNTSSFYTATLTQFQPQQTLSAALFTNNNTFYSASIVRGAVSLLPTRFDNTTSFFTPTVVPGALSINTPLLTNSNVFYSATIDSSIVLAASIVESSNDFFNHVVSTTSVELLPSLFDNVNYFYSSSVFQARIATEYNNNNVVYVTAENVAIGDDAESGRTVFVSATNIASSPVVQSSRSVYIPAEYV